jgi:pyruvate-formate lyase-activating enzyme
VVKTKGKDMTNLIESIRSIFKPNEPVPPGLYQFIAPPDDPRNYRLHLRVEQDGSGVLIVNASTVLHLNETAAEYAFYLVKNVPAEKVAMKMAERYRVEPETAYRDYRDLGERILTLVEMPDLDPVTFLDFNRTTPYAAVISAPYRLDCALTYRLPEGDDPAFTPSERVSREISTSEWKRIFDKAWKAGIPHIVFTGGEPTLRQDLVELSTYCDKLGMVTGLHTDGLRLAKQDYLDALLQTGLDHIIILLQPENETVWDAIQKAVAGDIFVAVHVSITEQNKESYAKILRRLAEIGVHAVSLTTSSEELDPELQAARDLAASLDLELVWDLPVPYSAHNPVKLEVPDEELVEGAGRAWLYVEPDGDVLPTQGAETVMGNLLNDSWEKIWR